MLPIHTIKGSKKASSATVPLHPKWVIRCYLYYALGFFFRVDIINLLKEIKSTFISFVGAPSFASNRFCSVLLFSLLLLLFISISYYFVIIHLSAKCRSNAMDLCPCILRLLFACLHIVLCSLATKNQLESTLIVLLLLLLLCMFCCCSREFYIFAFDAIKF